MSCKLLLVRHGETVDNVNKIMQGQTDGCLTLLGMEQARELGRQLRGKPIDVFLSSDLGRAVETLRIIKEEMLLPAPIPSGARPFFPRDALKASLWAERPLSRLPVAFPVAFPCREESLLGESLPLLRERDWGSFTGRYIPDLQDEVWPDDIETLEQMKARAREFLDYVRQHYDGKTVLAVGHGIINKAIQSVYTGRPMNQIEKMANCEVRELLL